jgi:hypothetical protein
MPGPVLRGILICSTAGECKRVTPPPCLAKNGETRTAHPGVRIALDRMLALLREFPLRFFNFSRLRHIHGR